MYDVIIIGAGIIGCAAARELCKYKLNILVIESEHDVSCGASKANSGIIHAGYDCKPGTLKAKLNVRGVKMYEQLVCELDIPYRNNGSLVLCANEFDIPKLRLLYENGIKNGVPELSLLSANEIINFEPNVNPNIHAALYAKTAGIISPYESVIAFAENAAVNGVEFIFNETVTDIKRNKKNIFTIKTTKKNYEAKSIINAAGIFSDSVNNFFCKKKENILPQRGQYYLLDNTQRDFVSRTIFQLPTELGKGVLITPTVDNNILIGPNAEAVLNKEDKQTTPQGLDEILFSALNAVNELPMYDKITAFAGIRAKHQSKDFVIDETEKCFVNALGIDSPGLSAAPAIAEMCAGFILNRLQPETNTAYKKFKTGIKRFRSLAADEQNRLIKQNPAYGHVVCRCETVTEAEVVEAIHRPIKAVSLDAVKRRTRAQMGRCQGGFCTVKLIEILSRELGLKETDVVKNGIDSNIYMYINKFPDGAD